MARPHRDRYASHSRALQPLAQPYSQVNLHSSRPDEFQCRSVQQCLSSVAVAFDLLVRCFVAAVVVRVRRGVLRHDSRSVPIVVFVLHVTSEPFLLVQLAAIDRVERISFESRPTYRPAK